MCACMKLFLSCPHTRRWEWVGMSTCSCHQLPCPAWVPVGEHTQHEYGMACEMFFFFFCSFSWCDPGLALLWSSPLPPLLPSPPLSPRPSPLSPLLPSPSLFSSGGIAPKGRAADRRFRWHQAARRTEAAVQVRPPMQSVKHLCSLFLYFFRGGGGGGMLAPHIRSVCVVSMSRAHE